MYSSVKRCCFQHHTMRSAWLPVFQKRLPRLKPCALISWDKMATIIRFRATAGPSWAQILISGVTPTPSLWASTRHQQCPCQHCKMLYSFYFTLYFTPFTLLFTLLILLYSLFTPFTLLLLLYFTPLTFLLLLYLSPLYSFYLVRRGDSSLIWTALCILILVYKYFCHM